LELLDRVEGRIASEERDVRVQSSAGKQHQRETGSRLLIADANGSFFVERARSTCARLLSKYAWHRGHRRRRGPGFQYVASGRIIHIRVLPQMNRVYQRFLHVRGDVPAGIGVRRLWMNHRQLEKFLEWVEVS